VARCCRPLAALAGFLPACVVACPGPTARPLFSQSGDAFWDAAQQQLQCTGELHNNVRMTWGKALLPWAASPQQALAAALHLNHKYALDGCDPCSYSGVLWCFGQVGRAWWQEE
jgi:deoxyribodipyrimidine photolyase